jgi:hypothetical protein
MEHTNLHHFCFAANLRLIELGGAAKHDFVMYFCFQS